MCIWFNEQHSIYHSNGFIDIAIASMCIQQQHTRLSTIYALLIVPKITSNKEWNADFSFSFRFVVFCLQLAKQNEREKHNTANNNTRTENTIQKWLLSGNNEVYARFVFLLVQSMCLRLSSMYYNILIVSLYLIEFRHVLFSILSSFHSFCCYALQHDN